MREAAAAAHFDRWYSVKIAVATSIPASPSLLPSPNSDRKITRCRSSAKGGKQHQKSSLLGRLSLLLNPAPSSCARQPRL